MQIRKLRDYFQRGIKRDYSKFFLPVAVLWFSFRVIPKPSRALYPCQRATLSLFFVKLGVMLSTLVTSTTSLVNRKSVKILSVLLLVGVLAWDPLSTAYFRYRFDGASAQLLTIDAMAYNFPSNRVVRVHSDNASNWDFSTGYYWENVDQDIIDSMVEEGVKSLTGNSTLQSAWQSIMTGYTAGDTVAIKINGNDWWTFAPRPNMVDIDSLPQLTNAIIKGLKSIGVPEGDIRVIENTDPALGVRVIPSYYTDIVTASYPNVVFQYDGFTNPDYGGVTGAQVDFPYTGSHYINDQIASVDHLILVPIMKAITPNWGLTGTIKLMQGVISDPGGLHDYLWLDTDENPDVLIYKNQHIIGKTRLIVGDGMFGAWTGQHFQGGYGGVDTLNVGVDDIPKPWITFGNDAPKSLFLSVDPVAIDSIMYDHVSAERNAQNQVTGQSLAPFNEPQLIAGEAAGLGIREHGPPYTQIDYSEIELGAPGDYDPPLIGPPSRQPSGDVMADQDVRVSVDIIDAKTGVKNATLTYTIDNGTSWLDLPMTYNSTAVLYEATIPGQPAGTWVKYQIKAYDNAENQAINDNAGQYYVYQVVPEFPAAMVLPLLIVLSLIALILAKRKIRKCP